MKGIWESDGWAGYLQRHGPAMLLLARQIASTGADAEDAVQEGFLRFWRSRQQARDPVAYLFACVRSCALEIRRSELRHRSREQAHARPEAVEALFQAVAEQQERRAAIEGRLGMLPQEQREALALKIWAGLTFEQIGEALGIPASTAASRYRYALEKLREALCEEKIP